MELRFVILLGILWCAYGVFELIRHYRLKRLDQRLSRSFEIHKKNDQHFN